MFARSVFRSAQPLRQNIRRYATEPPKPSSNAALYGGLAVAAGFGSYYYLFKTGQAPSPGDLAPASKDEAVNVAEGTGKPKPAFTGGEQGFIGLKLDKVEEVSHNTKRLRFLLPEPDMVSGLTVASALLTKYKGPEQEKAVLRPYTPVSDEDAKGYLDLVVKVYPNGPMSEHLHSMAPDQRLDFKGPLPKYPWTPNKHDHIALIAGGTGATPMYQLARAIFKNPDDKTKVTLVFGNVTEDDILLKQEWAELENTYPQRFRAFYVLDNPPENWTGGKGFIKKELLQTVLPESKSENIKLFVCGPPGLYKAISGAKVSPTDQGELTGLLKEMGYSKDQVYKF
ncbi:MAG: DNA repair protein rad50 [Chaenotheca gracillima]|nr:MAG: DNA repair protein rad50 [Chaenotheca gracillima]